MGCGSTNCGTCRPSTSPAIRTPGEFGRYGVVQVRYGKAKKGSPPKRRSVLTVFDWTPEVIADWLAHGQPYMDDGIDLFPSERGALVAENTLLRRFRRYCDDLELPGGLDLHSLRRSYATHLIEDGWDAKFVQDQLGHEHASTTSLYTCVSSDFRIRTLRRVLDATIKEALSVRRGDLVKRQVDYTWRLAELMAAHGMHNSTDLIPRLAERGIQLSRPQVYRVVHQRPERVSLQLMAALCDIFGCGVEDLITVTATDVRRKQSVGRRGDRRLRPTSSNSTSPCGRDEPECSAMTINPNRRIPNTRTTHASPTEHCAAPDASRMANQDRTPSWPGEQLCNSCFYTAMRTRGICPICGHDGVLPGRANRTDPRPICLSCAGIPGDLPANL